MPQPLEHQHLRYLQQAGWTKAIRQRAFTQFGLPAGARLLEVGSGTGAITTELHETLTGAVIGLDRDPRANAFARASDGRSVCVTGLGERLPFPPASFEITCCHFLLLWVDDPLRILGEMRRVTRPGGAVLCLAEPDYGGRIDYPERLAEMGALQEESLKAQGATTRLGRRLRALMHEAGLAEVHAGVLGGEWIDADALDGGQQDLEWRTLAADLADRVPLASLPGMKAEVARAEEHGARILFVPTFYAWGTRPTGV